jgi:hypothetical protein
VFIYRKPNGGAFVEPSPRVVKKDDVIRFWNITECKAEVITKKPEILNPKVIDIPAASYVDATVVYDITNGKPQYQEYKVKLTCALTFGGEDAQYAVGGSDPGLIIEP